MTLPVYQTGPINMKFCLVRLLRRESMSALPRIDNPVG